MEWKLIVWSAVTTACMVGMISASADDETPTGVAVLCEVWRATDPGLVEKIEAATRADPGDASTIRSLLTNAAEGGAERASRFLTSTTLGERIEHDDLVQVRAKTSTRTSGGTLRSGFGGFRQEGTRLAATVNETGGSLSTSLELSASFGLEERPQGGGAAVPGDVVSTRIAGEVTGPSGVTRMFQSSTDGPHTFIVFVTASRL
jgi:hypothetical protein